MSSNTPVEFLQTAVGLKSGDVWRHLVTVNVTVTMTLSGDDTGAMLSSNVHWPAD